MVKAVGRQWPQCPCPAPAPPRPRSRAGNHRPGSFLLPPRPHRAQSRNCTCWGHLVALPRSPFVPRGGRAFEEVTPHLVSSPASCPCPASSITPAGPLGIRFHETRRPKLGAPLDLRACIQAGSLSLSLFQSLAMPQHTHTYMLTYLPPSVSPLHGLAWVGWP